MSLFHRKKNPTQPAPSPVLAAAPMPELPEWLEGLEFDRSHWFQVFSLFLCRMQVVQNRFTELVKDASDWHVDFRRGILQLGSREFPIQFLGSESSVSNSWLWAWKNVNNFPEDLLLLARQTKAIGEAWKLDPLVFEQFELDQVHNGMRLSVAACGLAGNYAYYRCPHANGVAFVGVSGLPEELFAPAAPKEFLGAAVECLDNFHFDHKLFVEAFLRWNQTPFKWEGLTLKARFPQEVSVEFEQAEGFLRIKGLHAEKL